MEIAPGEELAGAGAVPLLAKRRCWKIPIRAHLSTGFFVCPFDRQRKI
jgi:hypothetical protein